MEIMEAYKLLSKLRHLTPTITEGKIEWIGTYRQWQDAQREEEKILSDWEVSQLFGIEERDACDLTDSKWGLI